MILPPRFGRGHPLRRALLALLLLLPAILQGAPAAFAADSIMPAGLGMVTGYTPDVSVYGLTAYWDKTPDCALLKRYDLDVRWVAELAYWVGHHNASQYPSLWHISLTPMLRWTSPEATPARFFIEGGAGIGALSHTQINDNRRFGIAFQFDEQLAAGFAFGQHGRYEVAAFLEHVSNARLAEPNDGLTYVGLTLRAAFE
jgi:Lipid A 3-O-deacylase (PagL)